MAEDNKTTVKTDQAKTNSEPKTEGLETTTTHDGDIAINKAPAVETSPEPIAETAPALADPIMPAAAPAPTTEPATPSTGMPPSPPMEPPVVLSEADITGKKEPESQEDLSDQIEVLTGEVQALEAKIEKLTSGVAGSPESQSDKKPDTLKMEPQPAISKDTKEMDKSLEMPEKKTDETLPSAVSETGKPVNDIYSKLSTGNTKAPDDNHKDLNDDATIDEGGSGVGTIGGVLTVFGLIALIFLLVSPLLKDIFGPTTWEAIKAIAWPTATISLVLGFILSLFSKAKTVMKLLGFLLALVSVVMLLAVLDYGSLLGPLSSMLDPIASFYR